MQIFYFEIPVYINDPDYYDDDVLGRHRQRVIRNGVFLLNKVSGFYESFNNPQETVIVLNDGSELDTPRSFVEVKQILGLIPKPRADKPFDFKLSQN